MAFILGGSILNTGSGSEVKRPLVTVVIGGIISSTLFQTPRFLEFPESHPHLPPAEGFNTVIVNGKNAR